MIQHEFVALNLSFISSITQSCKFCTCAFRWYRDDVTTLTDWTEITSNMRVPHWGPQGDVDLDETSTTSPPDHIIDKPPLSDLDRLYSEYTYLGKHLANRLQIIVTCLAKPSVLQGGRGGSQEFEDGYGDPFHRMHLVARCNDMKFVQWFSERYAGEKHK